MASTSVCQSPNQITGSPFNPACWFPPQAYEEKGMKAGSPNLWQLHRAVSVPWQAVEGFVLPGDMALVKGAKGTS